MFFLHKKKQHLNTRLYQIHLNLANLWGKNWQYIQNTLDSKLHLIIQKKYQNFNLKIQKLAQEQTIKPEKDVTFYPRVVNNTDITFTNKEITLLEKET